MPPSTGAIVSGHLQPGLLVLHAAEGRNGLKNGPIGDSLAARS
jgi:hypothetical protein